MKIQVNKQNVGLRIKQLRQDKGYTLEEFGKLLGDYQANKATVLGWENGRSLPNKERIKAIAKFGEMSVNELLYGSVEEFVRENFPAEASEFYINYIRTNNIIFDINNPVNIIDTIDNKIRFEFIKHDYEINKYYWAQSRLEDITGTIEVINEMFKDSTDLNTLTEDYISNTLNNIKSSILKLDNIKKILEKNIDNLQVNPKQGK